MASDGHSEQEPVPLICMRDNVLLSPDNPRCPHPSSACAFREVCCVREALRRKRRPAAEAEKRSSGQ